ncbi:hypothetical protein KY362_01100 [Candidatus Woesearchaeota archaeon]|nr:hypothetical protein [Candidatus Woesearchaeota archaeon]
MIIVQIVILGLFSVSLFQYIHSIESDRAFERRFTSIDLALLTTAVEYAPGTMRHPYFPLLFEVPMEIIIERSLVEVGETGAENLIRSRYWFLSDQNIEPFGDSANLESADPAVEDVSSETSEGEWVCPDSSADCVNFFKTGKRMSFNRDEVNALQMTCPVLDTEDAEWAADEVFIAKVAPRSPRRSSTEEELPSPTERIAQRLATNHRFSVSGDAEGASSGSLMGDIPDTADIVIGLGTSGEEREPGSLVVYIPADESRLKARKLACFIINDLLTADSSVFYAQILPVVVERVEPGSPLSIFSQRTEDTVMVFLDISGFADENIEEANAASAIHNAVQRYYGAFETPAVDAVVLSYTPRSDLAADVTAGAGLPGTPSSGAPGAPSGTGGVAAGGEGAAPGEGGAAPGEEGAAPGAGTGEGGEGAAAEPGPAEQGTLRSLTGTGETPVQRMLSVCSRSRRGLDDGFAHLRDVTAYWVEEAMNDGAVYVRGGQTTERGTRCTNNGQGDWITSRMLRYFPDFSLPESCIELQEARRRNCLAEIQSREGLSDTCRSILRNSGCQGDLRADYQARVVDEFNGQYICADCKTFQVQLYQCGFGSLPDRTAPYDAPVVAATPGAFTGYDSAGRATYNEWTPRGGRTILGPQDVTDVGTCWDAVERYLGGQLQFGDIIQLPGHSTMYTGGVGLGYEIMEMGGFAFTGVRPRSATIQTRINGGAVSGIRLISDAEAALRNVDRGCIIRRYGVTTRFSYD